LGREGNSKVKKGEIWDIGVEEAWSKRGYDTSVITERLADNRTDL
jgi:hypothetical protein